MRNFYFCVALVGGLAIIDFSEHIPKSATATPSATEIQNAESTHKKFSELYKQCATLLFESESLKQQLSDISKQINDKEHQKVSEPVAENHLGLIKPVDEPPYPNTAVVVRKKLPVSVGHWERGRFGRSYWVSEAQQAYSVSYSGCAGGTCGMGRRR